MPKGREKPKTSEKKAPKLSLKEKRKRKKEKKINKERFVQE